MEFGVFDHLDLSGSPIERFYRERLELVEAYERAGFHAYHVAEHHLTPLGMAPSPSVFLAAAAQRTKRLRLVPMVYVAPLYHPLRLLEEIGMLDQMSGGRLEIAFGRGALEAELRFYDVDPAQSEKMHQDAVGFVLEALREGAVTVSEEGGGKPRLPLAVPPLQKPHPPLWYGLHSPLPKIGLGRFIFVDRKAGEARATAGRAYRRWHESFNYLSSLMGFEHKRPRPAEFDAIVEDGRAFAGTPEGVAEYVHKQMNEAGANYFVGQFAFGDLTLEETLRSVGLFAAEVIPILKRAARLAPA
jgi:alkanesulfonate monooxygenase SsuD/methylene tetrahydromethanopterin reductase-like flavin-dependent oxidoreductase (luciferase family)